MDAKKVLEAVERLYQAGQIEAVEAFQEAYERDTLEQWNALINAQ